MKIFKYTLLIIFACLFAGNISYAQLENKTMSNVNYEKEFFYIDPIVFYTNDSSNSRVDVYIEIPLENLQFKFVSSQNKYTANIEYSVLIVDEASKVMVNERYSSDISYTKDERLKNKYNSEFIIKSFALPTGKYSVEVEVRDRNNQNLFSESSIINVNNFQSADFSLSDIMLISNYHESTDGKKVITPLVTKNVGGNKTFYIFFEVNNLNDTDITKRFDYKISRIDNNRKNTIKSGTFDYLLKPGKNQKIEKFSSEDFLTGNYSIEITDKAENKTLTTKEFNFKWTDFPVTVKDLDLAIAQCIYIADAKEFDILRNAKTRLEKEKAFIDFWRSKDPTPNTAKNEVMMDYYNRIRIANERYSTHFPGWKSDMGMVYIIFGDPSSIDRFPFTDATKPYEIWDYYDINRKFVFVDNTGFGDFRLTEPIWNEKTRSY